MFFGPFQFSHNRYCRVIIIRLTQSCFFILSHPESLAYLCSKYLMITVVSTYTFVNAGIYSRKSMLRHPVYFVIWGKFKQHFKIWFYGPNHMSWFHISLDFLLTVHLSVRRFTVVKSDSIFFCMFAHAYISLF